MRGWRRPEAKAMARKSETISGSDIAAGQKTAMARKPVTVSGSDIAVGQKTAMAGEI